MKIFLESRFDKFDKLIAALLKLSIFVGGACVVAYSLRIGRFPQGLTVGDSLLLMMAAICFSVVVSIFISSLVCLGIVLSPLVRLAIWIASKLNQKLVADMKGSPYRLAPVSWFAALGAVFAVLIIGLIAQRDMSLAWTLPVVSIALYVMYSLYVSASSQLKELARIVESPIETPLRSDYGTLNRMANLRVSRWLAPLFILTAPLVLGHATGEVLDATMRAAKIRIESPVVYIKQPYAALMPEALLAPCHRVPSGYAVYEKVTVLFHGFGTFTVLSFKDGIRQRTLDIPNEYIIVER